MTASMLDEVQTPSPPRFFICPCCVLSFTEREKFVTHCETMKARLDDAVRKSALPEKKK